MADKEQTCHCPCFCDPTVPRQFEQSGGRYNDQSAFNADISQKNHLNMNMHFLATAQNQLEKHGLADMTLQLRAIQGQPAGA